MRYPKYIYFQIQITFMTFIITNLKKLNINMNQDKSDPLDFENQQDELPNSKQKSKTPINAVKRDLSTFPAQGPNGKISPEYREGDPISILNQ